jgi:hypothetical protein
MPIAMSCPKLSIAIVAVLISSGAAIAETAPDTENGRYALSPAGDNA